MPKARILPEMMETTIREIDAVGRAIAARRKLVPAGVLPDEDRISVYVQRGVTTYQFRGQAYRGGKVSLLALRLERLVRQTVEEGTRLEAA